MPAVTILVSLCFRISLENNATSEYGLYLIRIMQDFANSESAFHLFFFSTSGFAQSKHVILPTPTTSMSRTMRVSK